VLDKQHCLQTRNLTVFSKPHLDMISTEKLSLTAKEFKKD